MKGETLAAYRAARYRVFTDPPVDMRIGETSPAIARLLARHGVETAVFVTAFNPFSHPSSDADNAARQQALAVRLEGLSLATIPGAGLDPLGAWPGEASLLALGADSDVATQLMVEFEQNAVVFVDREGRPELLFHPSLADKGGACE
ncbi:hypothetical protein BGLT_01874 [Caballeronia glathei]|uniref:DUF3293 domain-containing protein n=1 Tax=Caballeronia glathei TaxID=60547 RepID=A0A069PQ78_9BURK|nr:DUF3293 domain-containing protein [Caballeronia glathei]KDR42024.1 hypothetical protein BG61_14010 [Caballeronia glathei]CDY79180.1 hypothetical protein BGLT_01874 [Caballeronia glathei]